jgi:predicted NBD/HSP70 family sugar kinase
MYIVADIGGTKTRIAASRDLNSFGEPVIYDTAHQYEEAIKKIVGTARELAGGSSIEHMVVGVPGTEARDHRSTFVSGTGPLKAWSNKPIAEDIERALETKVRMENDTALVGLGEAMYGAGRGADIVVYVTVSTGVGAARIVFGELDKVVHGSEMGGQYLSMKEGQTLEGLVSGTAISEKYGVHPRDLGKDSPVWKELAQILSYGVYNSLLHWSPDRVVLGGSMFNEVGISPELVRAHVKTINIKLSEIPEIVHSSLGDVGGLWGGLARLKQLTS